MVRQGSAPPVLSDQGEKWRKTLLKFQFPLREEEAGLRLRPKGNMKADKKEILVCTST